MSKIFAFGDLHLGHEKVTIARGFNSVDEHDNLIIKNYRELVTKHDKVYFLGDVCFKREKLILLEKLPGYKELVMGNHDKFPIQDYLKIFHRISGSVQRGGIIFTHIPIHPSELTCNGGRYERNIHGHKHDSPSLGDEYICLSLEKTNMKPVVIC